MGKQNPDLPPWEPIADWLARLPNVSCDEEHEDTREPSTASQKEIRERYEKTAKAIAYDIAVSDPDDEPSGFQVTHEGTEQHF